MEDIQVVGDNIKAANGMWTFAGETAKNFNGHVSKSVPLYTEGHDLVVELSDFFLHKNSVCYEIGCSVGTLLRKIHNRNRQKDISFYGIDIEQDMIKVAKEKSEKKENIIFSAENIVSAEIMSCDLIVSYYTVQFIEPKHRQLLINKLYDSLNWGGALILFEKVRANDARFQDLVSQLYLDYKLKQGYNPDQIISKSRSLKGVLEPFSREGNLGLLERAGFKDVMTIMKYLCFEGFICIK